MQLNAKLFKLYRILLILAFITYLYLLIHLTIIQRLERGLVTGMFLENHQLDMSIYFRYNINLIPFKTIVGYIINPPSGKIAMTNIAGNILAFLPLGFLTPSIIKGFHSWVKISMWSLGLSLSIEILQLLLRVGSADIDDLILNTLGGLFGYIIFKFVILMRSYMMRGKIFKNE